MKKMTTDERRRFLKGAATTAFLAASPITAYSVQQANPNALHRAIPESQTLELKVRGDLSGTEIELQLIPGEISPILSLPNNRKYRVKASIVRTDPRFGHIYALVLADANGKTLAEMNIAGNTTATFSDHRVQIYLLSIEQAT
ncbi:hypothetical protein [Xanthomonas campestris]|uniref:hypothetical protein n=1 Tax=Xanthomonas campestris TaxID=339 RepID=UPI001E569B6B|nr:hypothetical protein [Xanthomonas campestris]MCC5069566.1 hypothetical protein [Xanthomonas campestris]MCC5084791.1 hypothetical protein [Xanthomonas campestris]